MTKKFLFVIFLNFFQGYSQKYEDLYIHFSYSKSSMVGENIDVYVYNTRNSNNSEGIYGAKVVIHKLKKDVEKEYPITKEEYVKICKAIFKIKSKDIAEEVRSCLDSNSIQISIAKFFRNICTYDVDCLSVKDKKTKWKDYYKACLLILDTVNLKFSDLD